MKKILAIFIIPYLLFVGGMMYFFFGVGIFSSYQALHWNQIDALVPGGFSMQTYESKGWHVYYLKKLSVQVKIAVQSPAVDLTNLAQRSGKLMYKEAQGEDGMYYVTNPRKTYEIVYALNVEGTTLYFSVASPSVYSTAYILDKITANCSYNGTPIAAPKKDIPLIAYLTDFIFLFGMLLPFLLVTVIFSLSAKKPSGRYFEGDPIRLEENFVYFTRTLRLGRKSSFCYLALTATRLMVFVFGKPLLEIKLDQEKPDIKIQGKKIILQKDDKRVTLRPADIEKWKSELSSYLS